jgi:hypothetical protein
MSISGDWKGGGRWHSLKDISKENLMKGFLN